MDNRPAAVAQRERTEMLNDSQPVLQQRALSNAIHNSPRMVAQRHEMNLPFDGSVRPQGDGAIPTELSPVQREEKPNNTGLPNQLKSGIESLSGMSMDHVKVHYNSDKPAQLQAHAYAQGNEIHLGAGQERHLPHEAWHVVQQAQGRVRPTLQMKAGAVNDDPSLEKDADMMGEKAAKFNGDHDARNLVAEKREAAATVEASLAQREEKTNKTGLPNQLKSAIESLSPVQRVLAPGLAAMNEEILISQVRQGLGNAGERRLIRDAINVIRREVGDPVALGELINRVRGMLGLGGVVSPQEGAASGSMQAPVADSGAMEMPALESALVLPDAALQEPQPDHGALEQVSEQLLGSAMSMLPDDALPVEPVHSAPSLASSSPVDGTAHASAAPISAVRLRKLASESKAKHEMMELLSKAIQDKNRYSLLDFYVKAEPPLIRTIKINMALRGAHGADVALRLLGNNKISGLLRSVLDELSRMAEVDVENVDQEAIDVFSLYTKQGYENVTGVARGNIKYNKPQGRDLPMNQKDIEDGIKTQADLIKHWAAMPRYTGTELYRVVHAGTGEDELAIGGSSEKLNPTSTSVAMDWSRVEAGKVCCLIHVVAGNAAKGPVDIRSVSSYTHEGEVLLPPGTVFTKTGVADGYTHFTAQMPG